MDAERHHYPHFFCSEVCSNNIYCKCISVVISWNGILCVSLNVPVTEKQSELNFTNPCGRPRRRWEDNI